MKRCLLAIIFYFGSLFYSCSILTIDPQDVGITGLWKSRDQHSDKPRSLVAIYEYQGKFYGRMLATYDDNGKIKDTIIEKKEKSLGVVGNPPYCGMDFVYNLEKEEGKEKYKGKIIDPEKGHIYDAEFWIEEDVLIVRGEVWIFGQNIPWRKAFEKDLPKGFSMSKIKSFVPVIPIVE
jgi:uncharacterized protein (DUF2147 family)